VACGWLMRRAKHKEPLQHPLIIDPPGPEEFPHPSAQQRTRDRV